MVLLFQAEYLNSRGHVETIHKTGKVMYTESREPSGIEKNVDRSSMCSPSPPTLLSINYL